MGSIRSQIQNLFTAICLATLLLIPANNAAATTEHPNILLICVDDLKPTIGCYGDSLAITPNIDRLAAQGLVFTHAYCNQAVCSPSRNALMTSLRPQTLGIYDLSTNFRKSTPDAVTLGQFFQQQGYRTEAIGKIFHVGHGNTEDAASWSVPHFRPKATSYAIPQNLPTWTPELREQLKKNPKKSGPKGAAWERADVPDETYIDGQIALEAVRRLEKAKQNNEPFLLAVGFMKPHLPFVAPAKYWDLYDADQFELAEIQQPPQGAPSYAPQQGGELRNYRDMPKQGTLPAPLQRTLIHGYYASTSYMDAQLGLVLDALEQTGLAKKTIVVLWGDHGWHLGDHGIWCKHTNYEQAARIPVIVSTPEMPSRGQQTAALIETVDIYPTLAELAGFVAPAEIDGQSFAHVLAQPEQPAREAVIHVYPRSNRLGRAIRNERYRMVEWKQFDGQGQVDFELYDYLEDPLETKNLATAEVDIMLQLKSILERHPAARKQVK